MAPRPPGSRVAVVGMGVKTPAGNDIETFWSTVLAATATAAPVEALGTEGLPVAFGCQVQDFDPRDYFDHREARRTDRAAQLGVAAGTDAVAQAGDLGADPARCAVVAGTGIGGLHTLEEQQASYLRSGHERVSPLLVPMMMPNAAAAHLALRHGWTGPNVCVATACAAGAHAIGEGARLIRDGTADVVLAGGSEAAITPLCASAFWRMGALSTNPDPAAASRPFDAERDGFVLGEGAAFLVLERWDRAEARGATILGEVLGYGRNCDAHHITAPAPGGAGAVACMQAALADAGLEPGAVGHVNAHGTSTPLNDAAESEAIAKVFGGDAPPVTSTKGVTGHLIGAAGAVEAVASLLSMAAGLVPPTANHGRRGDDIAVDVVAGEPRPVGPAPVLSNSFGFGGHNASLVLAPA